VSYLSAPILFLLELYIGRILHTAAADEMKIAQIAPLHEAVPPKLYGGTERVVAHLCDALIELGHEVTLFAAAGSRTKARLVVVRDQSIRLDSVGLNSDLAAHLTLLWEAKRMSTEFDVLHFHIDMLHFPMFEQLAPKTVTTLHGRLDLKDLPACYERWPDFGLVSISDSQRRSLPRAQWLATVGHGVPCGQYTLNERPANSYLAFLGRMSPEKRPDVAIRLALRAGMPIRIAAKVDAADRVYFDTVVRPLLSNPLIDFVGEIGDERKSEFLANAVALLFPINWPEPFGLVMIEAMACGTPVIAWNCGSVPEIIDDGVTGFIVNSEDEACAAIARLPTLDRRRVRAIFERRFAADTMARAYVQVYARLLDANPLGAHQVRRQDAS
jgi:glycosyltransferase involved in cell wall biosynthesis